jgi:hypothetical protein
MMALKKNVILRSAQRARLEGTQGALSEAVAQDFSDVSAASVGGVSPE